MEGGEEVPPPPRSPLREVMWGRTENTRQGPKKGRQRVDAARAQAERRGDSEVQPGEPRTCGRSRRRRLTAASGGGRVRSSPESRAR